MIRDARVKPLRLYSISEQIADHLRERIIQGDLAGDMPGSKSLAAELGVNHKTISVVSEMLRQDGFLEPQGRGLPNRIVIPKGAKRKMIRVAILNYEPEDRRVHFIVDLQHRLSEAGHSSVIASKSLVELRMNPKKIAQLVKKTEADAWIVQAGSREVLQWFSEQEFPSFALFGNLGPIRLPRIAPSTGPAIISAVNRLIELGHRRIVMLSHRERVCPSRGYTEQLFLDELTAHGIETSAYNLPVMEDGMKGLMTMLDSLFQVTPPTALIINDRLLFFPVQLHLARKGILAPEGVSLISGDEDPRYGICRPSVAHIHWDSSPLVKRVLNWANGIASGRQDSRKSTIEAEFVDGGTVGPALKRG